MKDLEHQEQSTLMAWMELQHPKAYTNTYAIPNGGKRHIKIAVKLKKEGVKAGVPDICIALPKGPFHGMYLEYKTKTGRPTKEQLEWLENLDEAGYHTALCKGIEAAQDEINSYLRQTD